MGARLGSRAVKGEKTKKKLLCRQLRARISAESAKLPVAQPKSELLNFILLTYAVLHCNP